MEPSTEESTPGISARQVLPPELISQIISCFIQDGIQVSNHPAYDSDIKTIRTLLMTSASVRAEVLRQSYRLPLHIYITNGKACHRMDFQEANRFCEKVFDMPVRHFPEVIVYLAPTLDAFTCAETSQYHDGENDHDNEDLVAKEFETAFAYVRFHSRQLAEALDYHEWYLGYCWKEAGWFRWCNKVYWGIRDYLDSLPSFKFVFVTSHQHHLADQSRHIPLWHIYGITELLSEWQRPDEIIAPDFSGQIKLPQSIHVPIAIPSPDPVIRQHFPHSPQDLVDYFQAKFFKWWQKEEDFKDSEELVIVPLTKAPSPETSSPTWTINNRGILRITTSHPEDAQDPADQTWQGEILSFEKP